jgi:protein-tyrosine phosphatase
MLQHLARLGFTRVVATPHLMEPLGFDYQVRVQAALERLRPIASEFGIELELGYEHMVDPGLAGRLSRGEPSTLAGSMAVLVELPLLGWNYEADRHLFDLEQSGYRPILAHPERYVEVHRRPELVMALAARGVVLQITIASLAGVYGRETRNSARNLIDLAIESDAHVVLATDAHSLGRRLTDVPAGLAWIERRHRHGAAIVRWATSGVPSALLANEPVPGFEEWRTSQPDHHDFVGNARWFSFRSLNPLSR